MGLSFCVLYGSYREQREGIKAADYIVDFLKQEKYQVNFIDAKKEDLPLLDKRYMDYPKDKAPANLERLAELYRHADAFVIVSGEYNFSIQPGLKNLLDYFYFEYFHRPSGIMSYSISDFSGIRAGVQLRSTLSGLGMVTIPTSLMISKIAEAFDDKGQVTDASLPGKAKRFADELSWYARAIKAGREKGLPS